MAHYDECDISALIADDVGNWENLTASRGPDHAPLESPDDSVDYRDWGGSLDIEITSPDGTVDKFRVTVERTE